MSRLPPATVTITRLTPPAKCRQWQQKKKKTEPLHSREALLGTQDPETGLCLVFLCTLFPLFSRQCAVLAYNISKHQESKQSFEVWCTLLFKLKAIEAKCLQDIAGYRERASQQIPTQVLLHKKKKWTNLEHPSQGWWYIRPKCLSPLIPSCYWTDQVSVWTHSSRSTCQPANWAHFCCCDGHFHNAPAVLLLWWISPTHSECNTVHYLTSGTSVIVLSMPRAQERSHKTS